MVKTTTQVNDCELVRDTDQQFNDITLKSQNTPVIKSTPNMLCLRENTLNSYNNSKNQFIQCKINNTISKLENYVNQKFDEVAMKYLKENIFSDIKQQFSNITKAK